MGDQEKKVYDGEEPKPFIGRDYRTYRDLMMMAMNPTFYLYVDQYGRPATRELIGGLAEAERFKADEECTKFYRKPPE